MYSILSRSTTRAGACQWCFLLESWKGLSVAYVKLLCVRCAKQHRMQSHAGIDRMEQSEVMIWWGGIMQGTEWKEIFVDPYCRGLHGACKTLACIRLHLTVPWVRYGFSTIP